MSLSLHLLQIIITNIRNLHFSGLLTHFFLFCLVLKEPKIQIMFYLLSDGRYRGVFSLLPCDFMRYCLAYQSSELK